LELLLLIKIANLCLRSSINTFQSKSAGSEGAVSSTAAPPSAATHPGGEDAQAITAAPPPQEKKKPAPATKPKKKQPAPATKPKKKQPAPATKPKKPNKKKSSPAKHSSPSPAKHPSPSACQHGIKENYAREDAASYFTEKYLTNTPTWPSACATKGCSASFGVGYKVGINNPVFCCLNAKNKNHPCVHAYCKPCFEAWQGAASGNSPRKRKAKRMFDE
jgi:outer membrane biosynthesis protein TonB